jgi:hypothetical protein
MATKLNLAPRGTPCGKSRYYTSTEAEGHRSALESWERSHGRPALNLGSLSVYWCDGCHAYHVGHKVV